MELSHYQRLRPVLLGDLRRLLQGRLALALLLVMLIPAVRPVEAQPRVGVGLQSRDLGLQEAIEMALSQNLDIQIVRTQRDSAEQAVRAARGAFDPLFRWLPGIGTVSTPTSSPLVGSGGKLTERSLSQDFAFQQKLPHNGADWKIEFDNRRLSTTDPFTTLTPFTTSRLALTFTQPLLRDRRIDRDRAEIEIRQNGVKVSGKELELKVVGVVGQVEQAYWDLAAVREDEQVQSDSLKLAEEQLARTKRMIEAGTLASVELAASEAELERRRDAWYESAGLVTQAENALKLLIAGGRQAPLWNERIVPIETRSSETPSSEDLQQAIAKALQRRPELDLIGLNVQENDIRKKLDSDQVRPKVDFTATYANMGLAGALSSREDPFSAANQASFDRLNELSREAGLPPLQPISFGSPSEILIGGYGAALSNLFRGRFQTIQVGLAFDLNLKNRAAEASLSQRLVEERRLRLERSRLEQVIEAEVRNALQALETARQRIVAAEASERASREKLESETRLFQNGESTNFLVLTRQNEYVDARRRRVIANLDFNRATARLEQATGNTLAAHNLVLK